MIRGQSWPDGRAPVLLSAHAEELLAVDAAGIEGYLRRSGAGPLAVATQLARTRRVRRHRVLIRAADTAELGAGLRAVAVGDEHPLVTRGTEIGPARVAFVFPGQGGQWPGMGGAAYAQLHAYRAAADEGAAAFTDAGLPAPLEYLAGTGSDYTEVEIEGAQFVHHLGLAAVWRACGVLPDVVIGHSLGEVAAACVAGAMTLADAVAVVSARAGVVDRLSGDYAVAALGIGETEARALIEATPGWLELSVINGPTAVAVSGDREPVLAAVQAIRDRGGFGREITVNFPVHTSILEPLRDELRGRWPVGEFIDTPVQFISSATGDVVPAGTEFADYWFTNLREMVRFDRAAESAARSGVRIFVEMSAHPALLFAMEQVLTGSVVVGTGRRDDPLTEALSANLAAVAAALGDAGLPATAGPLLSGFPNAPMRAVHLWAAASAAPVPVAPAVTIAVERWQQTTVASTRPPGRVALVPLGPGRMAAPLAAALARLPGAQLVPAPEATTLIALAPAALDDPDPAAVSRTLAQLVDGGLLGYLDVIGTGCRRVCLITMRGEQAQPADPAVLPGPAALAAMHRSAGYEFPDVEFTHVDIPANDVPRGDVDPNVVLAAALGGPGTGAIRSSGGGPALLRRDFVPVPPVVSAPTFGPGMLDDVVITGGSGVIAGHYARALAALGARRIVLLSRRGTAPPEPSHGTELVSVACDITDPDAVAAAAARHGGQGASVFIHAAGAATFAPAAQLDGAVVGTNCAAKITGLAVMTTHWPLRSDARIVLCSSVSGIWGGRGHAGYAAANRMLDVMAAQLRSAGRDCTAVRWGLWQGGGIVDEHEAANITRSGLLPMDPATAIRAGFTAPSADPLAYCADAGRLEMFLGRTETEMAERESGLDAAAAVRAELAAVLSMTDTAVDLGASLFDLGVDSLLAVDLRKRLRRRLGRTVPLAALLGGITGSELVGELETTEGELRS